MIYLYNFLLFLITLIGGSVPLWRREWTEKQMKYLLAFSGAYLLSITMLHLIPEGVEDVGNTAGILILAGFFLQQILQRFTHGVEHGHSHLGHQHAHIPVVSLLLGLAVHALTEGIPLGASYHEQATTPALYLAIALHKLPEAMLITSMLIGKNKSKIKNLLWLAAFATLTPLASMLTVYLDRQMATVAYYIPFAIAVVTGSFLHIGTTIFFESGTKLHEMSWKKWSIIGMGIGLALLTLVNNAPHHHT